MLIVIDLGVVIVVKYFANRQWQAVVAQLHSARNGGQYDRLISAVYRKIQSKT